ncbi:hypothetical protein VN97_g323 [Penicillium thymicola]|uniref:Uncharacterized protein n=1 Tax=Penicillium thymicola TaxID=293382 RepID=A0AAI9TT09_PENTH|nr:hypothetical protein VN97_g323 [Penicillium thymicola]
MKQFWNIRRKDTESKPSKAKQLTDLTTFLNPIPNKQKKQRLPSSNPPLTSKSNLNRYIDPTSLKAHANSVEFYAEVHLDHPPIHLSNLD